MRELSIFIDESGDIGSGSRFYLLTLVFHDQANSIDSHLARLAASLADAGLPNTTFHFTPVLRGHERFATYSVNERKSFLARFRVFTEKSPIEYKTFVFRKHDYKSLSELAKRMEKDLRFFLYRNLAFFQKYDLVKIYYDNGQKIVRDAIHLAISETISKTAIVYKDATPKSYRLFQMADYICGIELTAIRYENSLQGQSEHSFFGGSNSFKKNWLKKLRNKRLGERG